MSNLTSQQIEQLSVAERIQLVEDIWDSIAATPERLDLTEGQRQELDDRLAAYHRDSNGGSSWAQVKARLQSAKAETAVLSEAALAAEWNRPEEEEAWSHLQLG